MIVSDEHRYVFVELPRTGCTAIARELKAYYGGESVLAKHSTYFDFLVQADERRRGYFVFGGIRNPLDDAVSRYFKSVTDHKGRRSGQVRRPQNKQLLPRLANRLLHRHVSDSPPDFATFFRRAYRLPYDNWASQAHEKFDHVVRFEQLQADFDAVLGKLGLEPVRPLPVVNPTAGRERDYLTYYTPDIIPRAKRVFGPFMRRWGYAFPPEWAAYPESRLAEVGYRVLRPFRGAYWRFVRPRIVGGRSRWRAVADS